MSAAIELTPEVISCIENCGCDLENAESGTRCICTIGSENVDIDNTYCGDLLEACGEIFCACFAVLRVAPAKAVGA